MPCYAGLDASKSNTHICVMDSNGNTLMAQRVETSSDAIANCLRRGRRRYARVGIEASSVANVLYEGLIKSGLPIICIEARHAHSILKTQPNKTDKEDARGIANLMRTGTYRIVHIKTANSQFISTLLSARKILLEKSKDIQNAIRGFLIGFGIRFDAGRLLTFDSRARAAISNDRLATAVVRPLLSARLSILAEIASIEAELDEIAAADPVCRLLTTAPGVGTLTALTFRSEVDVPTRFPHSRSIGPYLGLVPRTFQSGKTEWRGRISRRPDNQLRAALFCSAMIILRRNTRPSWLKVWGEQVASRRGRKRAVIAVARRLAIALHGMWITNQPFRWEPPL